MVSKEEQKKPLHYKLGDGDKNQVLQQLFEAGFGNPNHPQMPVNSGHKSTEGQPYAAERKRDDMDQGQVESIAKTAAADVVRKLEEAREARSPATGPHAKDLLQVAELLAGALGPLAMQNQEGLKLAAKEAANEVATAVRSGAFEKSRLAKAEDAGWQALGIATGVTLGGVAVFALKKTLAL